MPKAVNFFLRNKYEEALSQSGGDKRDGLDATASSSLVDSLGLVDLGLSKTDIALLRDRLQGRNKEGKGVSFGDVISVLSDPILQAIMTPPAVTEAMKESKRKGREVAKFTASCWVTLSAKNFRFRPKAVLNPHVAFRTMKP